MLTTLKEMLASKKAIAAVAGVILTLGAKYGLNLDPELVNQGVAIVMAYIVGQGIADIGKNAPQ